MAPGTPGTSSSHTPSFASTSSLWRGQYSHSTFSLIDIGRSNASSSQWGSYTLYKCTATHYCSQLTPRSAVGVSWYKRFFLTPTHHHHATEESIYFPWVASRGAVIPARLSADHETMMRLLDAVKEMEKDFATTRDHQAREALAATLCERVNTLAAMMREHLNEEEVFIPPILRDHFTEQDGLGIVAKIIPSRGLDNLWLLPGEIVNQCRIGGDDSRDYLLANVPGLLRWHWRMFSVTWYQPENLDVINSLLIDSDQEPPRPKYRGVGPFRWYPQSQ